jgi:hypothetical protein
VRTTTPNLSAGDGGAVVVMGTSSAAQVLFAIPA